MTDFVDVVKPIWLSSLTDPLHQILAKMEEGSTQQMFLPKNPEDAIPVRLSDGDNFYKALDAIFTATRGGGGGGGGGGSSSGATTVDGSTFTQGTTTGTLAMGVYVASPQTLTTGASAAIALDVNRNVMISPSSYATDDSAMPDTPKFVPTGGEYRSSATTYTDGDATVLQTDVNGNLKVTLATYVAGEDLTNNVMGVIQKPIAASTYSPSTYAPLTQVTKANIKASTGNVFSIYITNDNSSVRYFQLHNKATAPAATNVPLISVKVPAAVSADTPGVLVLGTDFFTTAGKNFSTGIGWAISTTFATFTDSATNTEHIVIVNYV